MIAGAGATLALKVGAGTLAGLAVVGLGLVFWPTVKSERLGGKPAVEQPVFVTASVPKVAMAAPTTIRTGATSISPRRSTGRVGPRWTRGSPSTRARPTPPSPSFVKWRPTTPPPTPKNSSIV